MGQGAITAVLGANGAGKTTLLRAISGMVRVRRGAVRLDGVDVTRAPSRADLARAGIAHVPEGPGRDRRADRGGEPAAPARWSASGRTSRADRSAALAQAYEQFPVLAERRRKPGRDVVPAASGR